MNWNAVRFRRSLRNEREQAKLDCSIITERIERALKVRVGREGERLSWPGESFLQSSFASSRASDRTRWTDQTETSTVMEAANGRRRATRVSIALECRVGFWGDRVEQPTIC